MTDVIWLTGQLIDQKLKDQIVNLAAALYHGHTISNSGIDFCGRLKTQRRKFLFQIKKTSKNQKTKVIKGFAQPRNLDEKQVLEYNHEFIGCFFEGELEKNGRKVPFSFVLKI